MLTPSTRPATLKYLTSGRLGVAGLNTSLRYLVVKLAYAGESRTDRRRVVKEDGRDDSERSGLVTLDRVDEEPSDASDETFGMSLEVWSMACLISI
jgi:hypothetical protein